MAALLTGHSIRADAAERIREFVASCSEHLGGHVLDYGAGKQPYRFIVPGDYVPFDRPDYPGSVVDEELYPDDRPLTTDWDAILCTQVIQYVPYPDELVYSFHDALSKFGGHLVLTGPTTWPEIEPEDLHRFTRAGISRLLTDSGFEVLRCERLVFLELSGFELSVGYGVLAQPR